MSKWGTGSEPKTRERERERTSANVLNYCLQYIYMDRCSLYYYEIIKKIVKKNDAIISLKTMGGCRRRIHSIQTTIIIVTKYTIITNAKKRILTNISTF